MNYWGGQERFHLHFLMYHVAAVSLQSTGFFTVCFCNHCRVIPVYLKYMDVTAQRCVVTDP